MTKRYVFGSVAALFMVVVGSAALAQTAPASAGDVTFTKDVLPILQRSCQGCHRPGAIAPMSLISYQDVRPWARSIKRYVEAREMQPWYIDRRIGIQKFKDDPSLTDEEIATIAAWVDSGAPRGNPADAPPPMAFPSPNEWRIGEPDLVVSMPEPYMLPAEGPDAFPNILADPGLTTDRYIQAVEVKPDANSLEVVHHAVTTMTEFDEDLAKGNFLNEYAVGKNGDIFDDNTGRLIKAGTKIKFGLHLHPYGEEIPVMVHVGLKLYPEGYVPKYQLVSQHMGDDDDLLIPAGEKGVRTDGYTMLTRPAVVTAFQPHLHTRGQAQCIEAIIPQTDEEGNVLIQAPGHSPRAADAPDDAQLCAAVALQLAPGLQLRGGRGADLPARNGYSHLDLARQLGHAASQSGSAQQRCLRPADDRRNVVCLGELLLHRRGRVQGAGRRAECSDVEQSIVIYRGGCRK